MFRHTFVSILLSNPNIGVATVAAEAGHAQPSTTLAIYTQVYDKQRKEIRNQMRQGIVQVSKKEARRPKPSCFFFVWASQDLNPGPSGYEPPALTN